MNNWFKKDFFRTLVDQHIPDFEGAMEKFDPEVYAENMARTGAKAAYVSAASCLGLCYFPTKVGLRHRAAARDIFGATVSACRARGLHVVGYMNSWGSFVCDAHPEWSVVDSKGVSKRDLTRFGNPCVNNKAFCDYINGIAAEIVQNYEIDGLWIDMTGIWTPVCFCPSCAAKYRAKTGKELPRVTDLNDPAFAEYFKFKRESVSDYQQRLRQTALAIKPEITVSFQGALLKNPYFYGQGQEYCANCDYLSGDFHADVGLSAGNVILRLYNKLTNNLPFEYMIGRCAGTLEYHTMQKPFEEMEATAYAAYMHQGSFMLIDAIDPSGELNENYYREISALSDKLKPYLPYIDYEDRAQREIAVYFNFEACAEHTENGKPVDAMKSRNLFQRLSRMDVAMRRAHLDYDVITKKNLAELQNYKLLILSSLEALSRAEIEAIRAYVKNGGRAYISGYTSLHDDEGHLLDDFMLCDVMGVHYAGDHALTPFYLSQTDVAPALFGKYTARYPHMLKEVPLKVTPFAGETLATVTLPASCPDDRIHFTSAISDPPVCWTEFPAIQENTYGKGRVIYCVGKPEDDTVHDNLSLFTSLLQHLLGEAQVKVDAPECVEHVLYESKECWKLNLLNHQLTYPAIPIHSMHVEIDVGERRVDTVRDVCGSPLDWKQQGQKLCITLDLPLFRLLLIKFA